MKIKTKLQAGLGILLILITLLAFIGAKQVHSISRDTENILEANYNTLEYARLMFGALNEIASDSSAIGQFKAQLIKQQGNVTEPGEKEITDKLTLNFDKLMIDPGNTQVQATVRRDLNEIMFLNMKAIERKSNIAMITARDSYFWLAITGTFCFLIAFVLFLNLPGNIANPIKQLTASIREIAAMNYDQRVHLESHDEFGELASSFNTMAKKLEEYNNSNLSRLMMEKKRIETLINNMHDPVIGLDENKIILFANEEAFKVLALKPGALLGKPAQDVAVTNDLMRSLLQGLMQSADGNKKALKIYADQKESYFEKEILDISIVPTGEQEKQLIGHVIILRNVTSYKELDFAKTNFIATVSHEFKTPIAAIKMSLQILESERTGKISEEQKYLLDSIKDDANRMLKITAELLNMAQVESGNIQLSMLPSVPKDIVQYAISANKVQAEQKNIKLEVVCPDALPRVLADSEKTAWVLTNLISNAIRYSHDNASVLVSVTEENNQVKFSVKDTGQGIAPQYKDKIFDRYFRVPGTKKEGTGLGLAISKEFIEAQGGKISVETGFGTGSEFIVALSKAS